MNPWLAPSIIGGVVMSGGRAVTVSDFVAGLGGWWTNDAPLCEKCAIAPMRLTRHTG